MKHLHGTDMDRWEIYSIVSDREDENIPLSGGMFPTLGVHLGIAPLNTNMHSLSHSWEDQINTEGPGIANGTPDFLSHIKAKK